MVLDPGHQLGNANHPAQVNRLVDAGGFQKACDTTGTSTDAGYPEATFTLSVALDLRARLQAAGAQVFLTRSRNSPTLWGPCIDERGKAGGRYHADAVVVIHADGEPANLHGFFVIRPALLKGWTDDIYAASAQLATAVHDGLRAVGLPNANYVGGDGYDVRGDLGTLNWESRPAVLVELGNMRNPTEAAQMTDAGYRDRVYAAGLARGITAFLTGH